MISLQSISAWAEQSSNFGGTIVLVVATFFLDFRRGTQFEDSIPFLVPAESEDG